MFLHILKHKRYNGYVIETSTSIEDISRACDEHESEYQLFTYAKYDNSDYCYEVLNFIFKLFRMKLDNQKRMVLKKHDIHKLCRMIVSFTDIDKFNGYSALYDRCRDAKDNLKSKRFYWALMDKIIGVKQQQFKPYEKRRK